MMSKILIAVLLLGLVAVCLSHPIEENEASGHENAERDARFFGFGRWGGWGGYGWGGYGGWGHGWGHGWGGYGGGWGGYGHGWGYGR